MSELLKDALKSFKLIVDSLQFWNGSILVYCIFGGQHGPT